MNVWGAKQYVYFATKSGKDAVKVGVSIDPAKRCALAGWSLIASMPGCSAREYAVHWALREHATAENEWFKSCPAVWRLILEVIDTGKLAWLPPSPIFCPDRRRAFAAYVVSLYGGKQEAADALQLHVAAISQWSPSLWARFHVAQMEAA